MKGNRLTISTLKAGEWRDKDEILLHAAFQILVDYVEKEKAGEVIDWNWDEHFKKIWDEIFSLYKWWKELRPVRIDPLVEANMDDKEGFMRACDLSVKLEKKWEEEDNKNLHRLIDIRSYLWT